MKKAKAWARGLHLGQLLMLSALLALVSCGAGLRAFATSGEAGTCAQAREFQDSLVSNRARLRLSDTVLTQFDLSQAADPLFRLKLLKAAQTQFDTAWEKSTPMVERSVVALRAQGLGNDGLRSYLSEQVHLDKRPAGFSADGAAKQLLAIHKLEADSLYMRYVRETTVGEGSANSYQWHDTTWLSSGVRNWSARCSRYHLELPLELILFLGPLSLLSAVWWWWFGSRAV